MFKNLPAHRKGLVFISFTAFLWSTSGFFIKYLTISAFHILFYRSFIAAITILIAAYIRKSAVKFSFDKVSSFSAIFFAGILILFVVATKMTKAANAIVLQFTSPIYLVFLEPLFFKTKFVTRNLITVLLCVAGMVLFFFGKLELGNIYGNLIAIGAGMSFAMFSLLLKYKKEKQKTENTLHIIIIGNFLVAVIAGCIIFPDFALDLQQTLILIYMGAIQIGISYMIFNEGIKYVSATESMIIAMLEAVFNPIWVFIGLGETPTPYALVGGALIFGAILWRNFTGNEKTMLIE